MSSPTPKDHDPITPSLGQVYSLTINLLYLKLLRGLHSLCSCHGPDTRLTRAVHRTEGAIVYYFLNIIPSSFYTPRMEIPLHALQYPGNLEDGDPNAAIVLLNSNSTHQNGSKATQSPLMEVSSSISPAVALSQGLSEIAERASDSGSRAADTVRPERCSSGSHYSSRATREDGGGSASLSEGREREDSFTAKRARRVSAGQFVGMLDTPDFSSGNASGLLAAEDGALRAPRPLSQSRVERVVADMQELHPSRSVESYPGSFPVSDGLDYSGLATASQQMRGRGATSVRPFSDV